KQDQRPDVERELEHRVELVLDGRVGHLNCHLHRRCRRRKRGMTAEGGCQPSSPATAAAKSFAANGERSSTLSPTPMKCTGIRCLAAIATRMPPRAVPSSLVITSPVTPAVFANSSTCDSAFCPT